MVEISLEDGDGILHSPYLLILPSTPSRILWAVDKKLKEDGDKSDAKSTGISTLPFFREFRQGRKGQTGQKFFEEMLLRPIKEETGPQGGSVAQPALLGDA